MELYEEELEQHLRSPDNCVLKIRRLGKSEIVKLVLRGSKLPN